MFCLPSPADTAPCIRSPDDTARILPMPVYSFQCHMNYADASVPPSVTACTALTTPCIRAFRHLVTEEVGAYSYQNLVLTAKITALTCLLTPFCRSQIPVLVGACSYFSYSGMYRTVLPLSISGSLAHGLPMRLPAEHAEHKKSPGHLTRALISLITVPLCRPVHCLSVLSRQQHSILSSVTVFSVLLDDLGNYS